jgi:beta-galactosidase
VALLLDWESWWALELDSHPSRLRLTELIREFYRPLFEAGVNADFAHPESDLSGYRLVLVPALYLVSNAGADNARVRCRRRHGRRVQDRSSSRRRGGQAR